MVNEGLHVHCNVEKQDVLNYHFSVQHPSLVPRLHDERVFVLEKGSLGSRLYPSIIFKPDCTPQI